MSCKIDWTWSEDITADPPTQIKASHFNEMRTNLGQLYTFLGIDYNPGCGPDWSGYWPLSGGEQILATHHNEVRDKADFMHTNWCNGYHITDNTVFHSGHHDAYNPTHHPGFHNGDNTLENGPNHPTHCGTDLYDKVNHHGTHRVGYDSDHHTGYENSYCSGYHPTFNNDYHGTYNGSEDVGYDAAYHPGYAYAYYGTVA